MTTLAAKPSLGELYSFIAQISNYPISVRNLLRFAHGNRISKEVLEFYKGFAPDQVFSDKDDLTAASEQVEIMREQSQEMPRDELAVPQED